VDRGEPQHVAQQFLRQRQVEPAVLDGADPGKPVVKIEKQPHQPLAGRGFAHGRNDIHQRQPLDLHRHEEQRPDARMGDQHLAHAG